MKVSLNRDRYIVLVDSACGPSTFWRKQKFLKSPERLIEQDFRLGMNTESSLLVDFLELRSLWNFTTGKAQTFLAVYKPWQDETGTSGRYLKLTQLYSIQPFQQKSRNFFKL